MGKKKGDRLTLTLGSIKILKKLGVLKKKIRRKRQAMKADARYVESGPLSYAPKSSSAHMYSNNTFQNTSNLTTENLRLQDAIMSQRPQIETLQNTLREREEANRILREENDEKTNFLLNREPSKSRFDQSLYDDGVDVPTTAGSSLFTNSTNSIPTAPPTVPPPPMAPLFGGSRSPMMSRGGVLPLSAMMISPLKQQQLIGSFFSPQKNNPSTPLITTSSLGNNVRGNSTKQLLKNFPPDSSDDDDIDIDIDPPTNNPPKAGGGGGALGGGYNAEREKLRDQLEKVFGTIPDDIRSTTRKKTLADWGKKREKEMMKDDVEVARAEYVRRGGRDDTILSGKINNLDFITARIYDLKAVKGSDRRFL